jgi:hypothetical protein
MLKAPQRSRHAFIDLQRTTAKVRSVRRIGYRLSDLRVWLDARRVIRPAVMQNAAPAQTETAFALTQVW